MCYISPIPAGIAAAYQHEFSKGPSANRDILLKLKPDGGTLINMLDNLPLHNLRDALQKSSHVLQTENLKVGELIGVWDLKQVHNVKSIALTVVACGAGSAKDALCASADREHCTTTHDLKQCLHPMNAHDLAHCPRTGPHDHTSTITHSASQCP
jgi:hypothetical protein